MTQANTKNYRKLPNAKGKIITTQEGQQIISIVEEEPLYTFKYTLPGSFFFTREDGTPGRFDGNDVIDDITEKEKKKFLKLGIYKDGQLVEETESLPSEDIYNRNTLNEKQIIKLFKKHNKSDSEYWKDHIEQMDSDYALKRLKDLMNEKSFPNSIVTYCDARIATIEEELSVEMREPEDAPPKGI